MHGEHSYATQVAAVREAGDQRKDFALWMDQMGEYRHHQLNLTRRTSAAPCEREAVI